MSDLQLNDAALPILFQRADSASLSAQANHYRVLVIYLLLLILSAILSFIWPENRLGAASSAVLFSITLVLSIIQARSRATEIWYKGRALAESVKTSAWRWVMQAPPYHSSDMRESEQVFAEKLQNILLVNEGLHAYLLPDTGLQNAVSETMRTIRALPFAQRLEIYKQQRVDDQASWYHKKAKINQHKSRLWRRASVALNLLALVFLLFRVVEPARNFPIDVIATAAGSVVSWIEAKKYDELKSSYALAADEINEIQTLANNVTTEAELADFVLNSERAFSREHTQWVARRT